MGVILIDFGVSSPEGVSFRRRSFQHRFIVSTKKKEKCSYANERRADQLRTFLAHRSNF